MSSNRPKRGASVEAEVKIRELFRSTKSTSSKMDGKTTSNTVDENSTIDPNGIPTNNPPTAANTSTAASTANTLAAAAGTVTTSSNEPLVSSDKSIPKFETCSESDNTEVKVPEITPPEPPIIQQTGNSGGNAGYTWPTNNSLPTPNPISFESVFNMRLFDWRHYAEQQYRPEPRLEQDLVPVIEPTSETFEQQIRRTYEQEKGDSSESENEEVTHPLPPEWKNVYSLFRNSVTTMQQKRDNKIGELKIATSALGLAVNSHASSIDQIRSRISNNEQRIQANTEAIGELGRNNEQLATKMMQIAAHQGAAIADTQRRFIEGMQFVSSKFNQHDEILNEHDKVLLAVVEDSKRHATDIVTLKRGAGNGIPGSDVKSTPIDAEPFRKLGIVFNESERYHPQHFVKAFETNTNGVAMTESCKCNLFRTLIEIKAAKNWKQYLMTVDDYEKMVQEFFAEFWSEHQQREAVQHFRDDATVVDNVREMARYILKWLETLKYVTKMSDDERTEIAYGKIPPKYHSRFTQKDRSSLKKLIEKLTELQHLHEEKDQPKKIVVGKMEPQRNANERFTAKDYDKLKKPPYERVKTTKSYDTAKPNGDTKAFGGFKPFGEKKSSVEKKKFDVTKPKTTDVMSVEIPPSEQQPSTEASPELSPNTSAGSNDIESPQSGNEYGEE